MSEVKGIYFNNGIQAAAKIMSEDDRYIVVENMLGIQLNMQDPEHPMVSFEDMTPFAYIEKYGLDTKIPRSSIMFLFPLERQLSDGYNKRTSLILH